MFNSLIKDAKETSEVKMMTPVFHSIDYQLDTIVDRINKIEKLSDNDLKIIISRQHQMILNYDLFLSSSKTRNSAQMLFTNKRFLKIFGDIVGLLNLSRHEIVCLNKLAYDYMILPVKDEEVVKMLLGISYTVNNILVIRLSGKLGMNGARLLALIFNSTFREEKRVHRVNTFLVKCDLELSVQDIVDIFCILYDRFSYPFIYSMFEAKPNNMNPLQNDHFDRISLALINILNSMTSEDIKKILFDYAFLLKSVRTNITVRFALKSLTLNTRILKVIQEIEMDPLDELFIP